MNIRPLAASFALLTGSVGLLTGSPAHAGPTGCYYSPSSVDATFNLFDNSLTPATATISGDASGLPNFAQAYFRVLVDGVETGIMYLPNTSGNPWNINSGEFPLADELFLPGLGQIDPSTIDVLVVEQGFNPDGTTYAPYCSFTLTVSIVNEEPSGSRLPDFDYRLPVVSSTGLPDTL